LERRTSNWFSHELKLTRLAKVCNRVAIQDARVA
jgi:hypothetical protein